MVRSFSTRRRRKSITWSLAALEARILLAGDVADQGAVSEGVAQADNAEISDAGETVVANLAAAPASTEVVFVDAAVGDLAQLAEPIAEGADLVLLQPDTDGVQQISDYLQRRHGIRAVHVISHGASGAIQVGSTQLSNASVVHHAGQIREWSGALAEGADVLIYGCDVASDQSGKQLLEELARLTGADVAASIDRTANARHEGNWDLEYTIGSIESAIAISPAARDAFAGHLAIEIRAAGSTGDESMELLVDDQVVQTWNIISDGAYSGQFDTYTANLDGIAVDRIKVRFTNDLYIPEQGIDRNLRVDWIRVDGVQYETEADDVFSTGTWVQGVGIASGYWQSEYLHTNGYLQYSPALPQTPTIEFDSDNFIVNESQQSVSVIVTRLGNLDFVTSTIDYNVPGGFAVPGEDYTPVQGTLTFGPGEFTKSFSIPIINDSLPEGIETFTVELSGASNSTIGTNRTTIVTIVDDDNVNPPGSLDVQLPSGFTAQRIAGDVSFAGPTGLKVADDGRVFVTEKFGRVYVVENGLRLETPFLDLESEVYSVGTSQGLAGFALDPDFASNGHVYVLYTTSENGVRFGRLERYTVSASNPNQVDPSTRLILIGTNASNGFPDGGDIHLVGDMQFGTDGSLLVSYGDAAGNGDNNAAFNAQNLDNLAGAISRINPQNGQGYASNPFFTGDLNDVRSKIWAYGLRNPYRFAVASDGSTDPNDGNPGTLYIGDVQFQEWEELNIARGGENFGWPYYQGNSRFLGNEPASNFTAPAVAFPRSQAQSSIGGAIVGDGPWPEGYQGRYLHADYVAGWIRSFALDGQGNIVGSSDFATGANGITDLEWDPVTGRLYFVALNQANNFQGELYAVSYIGSSETQFEPLEISTGADGVAFATTTLGDVWRRDSDGWTQLPGNFEKITVHNANDAWGLDSFGNLSRWNGSQWQSVLSEPLNDIGVSANGELWGVNSTNKVMQFVGDQWVMIGGSLVDIEVAPDGVVWGVNSLGMIWQRAGGQWTRIGGTLTDISVGADGSVWGTNAQNKVWRWAGMGWQQQDVFLKTISVTTDSDVWGVDPDGQVQRWNGVKWQFV
jgi:glucose/arabinose dehydrogenase